MTSFGGRHANRELRHRAIRFHGGLGRVRNGGHTADFAFGGRHELHLDRAVFARRELADLPHDVAAFGRGVGRRADKLRALGDFVANQVTSSAA